MKHNQDDGGGQMVAFFTVTQVNYLQGDPKKRAPILIRPRFLVFYPNEMKLWS